MASLPKIPKMKPPAVPASKSLASGKMSFKTSPDSLIGPETGKRGKVVPPINQIPEYHRKTASGNRYLDYLFERYSE